MEAVDSLHKGIGGQIVVGPVSHASVYTCCFRCLDPSFHCNFQKVCSMGPIYPGVAGPFRRWREDRFLEGEYCLDVLSYGWLSGCCLAGVLIKGTDPSRISLSEFALW